MSNSSESNTMPVFVIEQQTISDLFSRQVEKALLHPAVSDDRHTINYEQLNGMANKIALEIIDKTGKAEARVCILAPQSISAVAGLLGVLKAGKCFVPMLPQESDDYLRYLWGNSTASLIICDSGDVERAISICGNPDLVVVVSEAVSGLDVSGNYDLEAISAIMYTSGSTGQPKGVMTTGQAILGRAIQHIAMACVTSSDRQASVVPWQFSASFPDIFAPLLAGASLFLYDNHRKGIERLGPWIKKNSISLLHLPAALIRRFVEYTSPDLLTTVRYVYISGGGLKAEDAKSFLDILSEKAVLMHGFGSTETNLVTFMEWRRSDPIFTDKIAPPILPAGYPVSGKKIQIVDGEGRPVAPAEEGELVVVSGDLFTGYWRQPEMTAQSLRPLPDLKRAYHTGDLARIRDDGCLEIIGRKGHRVKIRGLRIDLKALESFIKALPYVKEAAAIAFPSSGREAQLVAYLEVAEGEIVTTTQLREDLKKIVPSYMIPSRFVIMETLPRTANGKTDYNALPAPGRQRPMLDNPYVPPRTALEKLLADIWEEVLGIEQVGIHDNFLELGGDSLLVVEMGLKLEHEFGNEVQISGLLQASTIAQMAEIIEAPEAVVKFSHNTKIPLRLKIKYLRRRIKNKLIKLSPRIESFTPPYKLFLHFQKIWISLPSVRFKMIRNMIIFKKWLVLTGQNDDKGELMARSLMADTWRFGRNFLMAQRKTFERWIKVVGWEHVLYAAQEGKGAIFVVPHTHVFFPCIREHLTTQIFPEMYHLGQNWLPPGRAAKTIGLAERLREALCVLKRGGAIWVMGDGSQGTIKFVVERYGGYFSFRAGAAELAVQTGAPLIPVFPSINLNGSVQVKFHAPLVSALNGAKMDCVKDILRRYAEIYVQNWPQMLPSIIPGHQRKRLGNLYSTEPIGKRLLKYLRFYLNRKDDRY